MRRLERLALPGAGTLAFFALLELVVVTDVISERAMPRPTSMAAALFDEMRTGHFWNSILHTLQGWCLGLAIAIVAAIPLGIIVGTSPWLYRSLRFVIDFLRPIPSVALLPLFILLFGLNLDLEAYIVALGAFWPLFFQTVYGVQDVDPVARDTAEAYRLNGLFRFFFVSLPGATPYIATGLRISASIALLLAVGTEMVVGLPGLGFDIKFAQLGGDTPRAYALIATSGLVGIAIALAFGGLEKRTLRWHPSQRKEQST